jgi:hypothetical protein
MGDDVWKGSGYPLKGRVERLGGRACKWIYWRISVMFSKNLIAAAVAAFVIGGSAQAAVILNISGGQLTGAYDIDIGGTLFDVSFGDGTCAGLFDGCDSASDFDFTDEASARAAAQALLTQVFIDSTLGNFDSDYSLTLGCESTTSLFLQYCLPFIPYYLTSGGVGGVFPRFDTDFIGTFTTLSNWDTSVQTYITWAKFNLASERPPAGTIDPDAVPEPSALGLLGIGFMSLGMIGYGRRRRDGASVTTQRHS